MASLFLGVDIGGTKIAAGLVDGATGQLLASERVPTEASAGGTQVLARAVSLAQRLVAQQGVQPRAVGVGAGGQIDPLDGVVVNATEILPGWKGQRLREAFTAAFGVATFCDNDVNALAVGESRFGAGQGIGHLAFLALGTGVGGALVHDSRLIHGPKGAGGELGHLLLYPDAPPYPSGTRGSLEQFTSGPAILARYLAAGGDPSITGPELAMLARAGDPMALGVVEAVGHDLGLGLTTIANIYGPEAFVLGGGVIDGYSDLLLTRAREVLRERGLPAVRETPVLLAALGSDAPLIGAASLAMSNKIKSAWVRP